MSPDSPPEQVPYTKVNARGTLMVEGGPEGVAATAAVLLTGCLVVAGQRVAAATKVSATRLSSTVWTYRTLASPRPGESPSDQTRVAP